jgi:hypothetical protein
MRETWRRYTGELAAAGAVVTTVAAAFQLGQVPPASSDPLWWLLLFYGTGVIGIVWFVFALLWTPLSWAGRGIQGFVRRPRIRMTPYSTKSLLVLPSYALADFVHLRVDNDATRAKGGDAHDAFMKLYVTIAGQQRDVTARPRVSGYAEDANEERVELRAGGHADFDVAGRFHGESAAYLINTEGLMRGGKSPDWEMDPGRYTVTAKLNYSEGSTTRHFDLVSGDNGSLNLIDRPRWYARRHINSKTPRVDRIAEGAIQQASTSSPSDRTGTPEPTTHSAQVPSRWLPDQANVLSLQLTDGDLDSCFERAVEYAKHELNPDARTAFSSLILRVGNTTLDGPNAPPIAIEFGASSKYVGRSIFFQVSEAAINFRSDQDMPFMFGPSGWDFDPPVVPWQTDSTWGDLVEMTWLRIRPFVGRFQLRSHGVPAVWQLDVVTDPLFAERKKRYFFLREGTLLEWEPDRIPPPENPPPIYPHGLISSPSATGDLKCQCGQTFSTSLEFQDHVSSGVW